MYFSNFPKIMYDFDLSNKTDYRVITDITRNIRFRKFILENISLFDYYDIQEGETPEIISEKIYGTPYYHWVIMIANEKYDYINDFPLTQSELDSYIAKKYGDNKYNIHHYLKNGKKQEGLNTVRLNDGSGSLNVGDIIKGQTTEYLARVEQIIENTPSYSILSVSLREGSFSIGEVVEGVYEAYSANVAQVNIPAEFSTVSNYDYEFSVNESKRRIKIIDPRIIEQIINEFQDVL